MKLFFNNQKFYFFVLTLFLIYILYNKSINYYFFQDDWFHINISNASNLREFINLFTIRTDIIAWRPISKQLFFFLDYKYFGLNPILPHLIIFSFFVSNVFLVYTIINKLFNSLKISAITSFMYATSAIHFIPLSWISAGEYVIGTFFWLSASLAYLSFRVNRNTYLYVVSIILFIICLASTEFALTWPLVIIGFEFLSAQKQNKTSNLKNIIKKTYFMFPAILIITIYLILRFVIFPLPAKDDYGLSLNIKTIDTYIWYILWAFNIPEIFKYQLILSKFTFSNEPAFIFHFKNYSILFFVLYTSGLLSLTHILFVNIKRKTFNFLAVSAAFFSITISPVLFLPKHTFPHYLSIPSIGIYAFIAYLFSNLKLQEKRNTVALIVLIVIWYASAYTTLSFTRKTHWIPGEQEISKKIVTKVIQAKTLVSPNTTIYLQPSTIQIKQSLMDQNAMQVIYKEKTIKTIFLDDKQEYLPNRENDYYVNLK